MASTTIERSAGSRRANRRRQEEGQARTSRPGIAHIQSTFNNTIVTITDINGNVVAWSSAGLARLQGLAQEHAVRRAARRRRRRAQGAGARHALGRGLREGPRRRPRERAARAPDAGFKVTLIRDVTPDPAQRLPPAQAPPRLIRTQRQSKRERSMARYIGPVCKLCRREGMKLYLKGERCYTEKCSFTAVRTRPASTARAASS